MDGDTLDCVIDLGFHVLTKKRVRLYGIDTWESRTRDLEEKARGLVAKARLQEIIEGWNGEFLLLSHGVGKYGRVLGEILAPDGEVSANDLLLEEGHAYSYLGGNKEEARTRALEILSIS